MFDNNSLVIKSFYLIYNSIPKPIVNYPLFSSLHFFEFEALENNLRFAE